MKSILIVVSASEVLTRFSNILSQAGYHVIAAQSGEEAIKLVTSVHLDLVLMAIVMPQLDGLQTAARVRAVTGPKSAPIVLLGSVTPIGIDEEPLASLVNGYLNVDVGADELLSCVARHAGSAKI